MYVRSLQFWQMDFMKGKNVFVYSRPPPKQDGVTNQRVTPAKSLRPIISASTKSEIGENFNRFSRHDTQRQKVRRVYMSENSKNMMV